MSVEGWYALRAMLGEELPGLRWDWARLRHVASDDSMFFLPRWVWIDRGAMFLPSGGAK